MRISLWEYTPHLRPSGCWLCSFRHLMTKALSRVCVYSNRRLGQGDIDRISDRHDDLVADKYIIRPVQLAVKATVHPALEGRLCVTAQRYAHIGGLDGIVHTGTDVVSLVADLALPDGF